MKVAIGKKAAVPIAPLATTERVVKMDYIAMNGLSMHTLVLNHFAGTLTMLRFYKLLYEISLGLRSRYPGPSNAKDRLG